MAKLTKIQKKNVEEVKSATQEILYDLESILNSGFTAKKTVAESGATNKDWLESSMVHFMLAMDELFESKDISEDNIMDKYDEAKEKA